MTMSIQHSRMDSNAIFIFEHRLSTSGRVGFIWHTRTLSIFSLVGDLSSTDSRTETLSSPRADAFSFVCLMQQCKTR
jgi:hypothetical protein